MQSVLNWMFLKKQCNIITWEVLQKLLRFILIMLTGLLNLNEEGVVPEKMESYILQMKKRAKTKTF